MKTHTTATMTCPSCTAPIPSACVLIEYERGDDAAAFAECPACGSVVRPT